MSEHDGHRRAFEALYRATYRTVLRFVERRVPVSAGAEDMTAEVFSAAFKQLQADRQVERAWLFLVAERKIADYYRARSKQTKLESTVALLAEVPKEQADQFELHELRKALQKLDARQRQAVLLCYWDGLSAAEIAEVMGCSESSAWALLSRGRKHLRVSISGTERTERNTAREGGR